jgi:hypothetical protein
MGDEPVEDGAAPGVMLVWRCHGIACTGSLPHLAARCWYRG